MSSTFFSCEYLVRFLKSVTSKKIIASALYTDLMYMKGYFIVVCKFNSNVKVHIKPIQQIFKIDI